MTWLSLNKVGLLCAAVVSLGVLGACSSDHPTVASSNKIPEAQAKASVNAHTSDLIRIAGLTPAKPVTAGLAACDQTIPHPQDYSVTSTALFPTSPPDAKQAITRIHDYMVSHGYTKISLMLNDSTYLVEGSVDDQGWGVDYYPNSSKELRIQGGTGCNVIPDGTDTPPTPTTS
jgi:hypothetical protein